MGSFGTVSIVAGAFVVIVYAVAAVLVVVELAVRPGPRWSRRRWSVTSAIALLGGAVIGWLTALVVTSGLNLFGVDLSVVALAWVSIGFGLMAVCVCSLVAARWWRRVLSALAIVVIAAATAMSLNIDIGTYPTVDALLGISPFADSPLGTLAKAGPPPPAGQTIAAAWNAPADMPATGRVSEVEIPGTASGFVARPALVYLPPAALTAHPPGLPVVITMSGQPGQPSDPLVSAHLIETLDAYAHAHHGLAPIVVAPDQLGAPDDNPMCVDGPLGNSATYLTVDVVDWISATLPVAPGPAGWGIAGFSQGGTCSIQLGGGHPQLFGSILDVSGELVPSLGDESTTVEQGFAGNSAAYLDAQPLTILKKHTPYAGTFAVFSVGQNDDMYGPYALTVSQAARDAGMTVTYFEAPGSAHDYTTATYAFARGFGLLADHFGLAS
ncbi:alpha/beta hydrolase [Subtercola sp. YIM 133946]|uniref:alpha/beta hydrolase n=1 Tax=Subtercola sp. YIM 133946 TaxID=3118909 RepID=UPI002F941F05